MENTGMIFIVAFAFLAFVVVCFVMMLIDEYFYIQENIRRVKDVFPGNAKTEKEVEEYFKSVQPKIEEMENKPKCEITKPLPNFIHDPENRMIHPDKRFCEADQSIFMAKMRIKAIEDEFNNDCA